MGEEQESRTYDPKKYRIVKVTPGNPNEDPYCVVHKKRLFWWRLYLHKTFVFGQDIEYCAQKFPSFDKAKEALLARIEPDKKPKIEVVYDK